MPKEISLVLLLVINVLYVAGSCASIAMVIRKWARREPLVPFTPRLELEMGGVFSWIRRLTAHARGEPTPAYHEISKQFWSDVRLGIVGFLVSFLPIIVVHLFFQQFIPYEHPSIEEVRTNPKSAVFLQIAFSAIVIASVLEELLFRNLLQGVLEVYERMILGSASFSRKWIFGAAPILISSLAFAGMHWDQGAAAAPLFLFALVLGYLYFQTHRLTPSIVAHAMLNLFTMLNLWFLR